jgi:hypothetical protein
LKRMRRHFSWSDSVLFIDSIVEMDVTAKADEFIE